MDRQLVLIGMEGKVGFLRTKKTNSPRCRESVTRGPLIRNSQNPPTPGHAATPWLRCVANAASLGIITRCMLLFSLVRT